MNRIDRKRFDAASFPVRFEITTRFDDLDMQGHVNNAAAVVILQEARANFNIVAGMAALRGNYAQAVMVFADANGAAPIPDGLRAAYERLMVL